MDRDPHLHERNTMSTTTRALSGFCLIMFAMITPLCAQDAPVERSGFGLSLGLGPGSAGVTCEDCEDVFGDRVNGISGYLRIGAHVSNAVFVGVEGTGWLKNSEGFERRIAAVSLVVLTYPFSSSGLFLRGGFGGIRAVIEYDVVVVQGDGLTWQAGAGYDVGLGPVAITPYVTYLNSMEVAAHINGEAIGYNLNPNILQFGLAFTVR